MQIEYRAHLVKDYGEKVVREFDDTFRRPKPVRDWQAVIDAWEGVTDTQG
jgi:hypothetical protein